MSRWSIRPGNRGRAVKSISAGRGIDETAHATALLIDDQENRPKVDEISTVYSTVCSPVSAQAEAILRHARRSMLSVTKSTEASQRLIFTPPG